MTRGEVLGGNRPLIRLETGEIERAVNEAEAALIGADRGLYQRSNVIVSVGDTKIISANDGEILGRRIFPRGERALLEDLDAAATFEKYDGRTKDFVSTDPPLSIVKTLMERTGRLRFPVLSGIINAPTLRADGSVIDRLGYDQATGLLFEPSKPTPRKSIFPKIAPRPSRNAALEALGAIGGLIDTFPFVAEVDRSVALSAILTACTRRSLRTAPMHAFTAPTAGSGKSTIVDIASVVATGREAGVIAQGKKEEELEKRLVSMFLAGDAIVSIDNCEDPLGSDFLCQVLTQPIVRVRILGQSKTPEVSTNAFVCATGNNLRLVGDMTRRALLCSLDPKVERPELRQFNFNPIARARDKRGAYVVAALTIMRAYITAGRPPQAPPIGSFEEWSVLVRGSLLWLGCADPAATMEVARASDPRLNESRAVMAQWWDVIGAERVTVARVIEAAIERPAPTAYGTSRDFVNADLREALLAVAGAGGAINSRRLGIWLTSVKGKIVEGRCFDADGKRGGSAVWKLSEVDV